MSTPGTPIVSRISVSVSFGEFQFSGPTQFLQVSNEGANAIRIYFTAQDFTLDQNYITLAPTVGYFEGPVALGENASSLFLRAVGGTSASVVVVGYKPLAS
jgi:hypothetical protein